jgi:hypothetical protein
MWKFDSSAVDLVFVQTPEDIQPAGSLDFGAVSSDISLDTGERTNDNSIVDNGERLIDGDI